VTELTERAPRTAYIWLALILIVAAVLRFIQLDYAPAGGHGDVAWIGINTLDWVDRGIWPFYVRELYAPEPFPVYLTGLLLPLTGISYLPQRIVTAALGVLFVAFLFPAAWWLLDGRPTRFRVHAALFTCASAALSLHIVALNRLGMESPPFLTVLALLTWLTARAWRSGGTGSWVLAGAALALSQYVFLAARMLPIVMALWILHGWFSDRARMQRQWRGWFVMAVTAFILTLPALILFITTPEAFSARADAGTAQTGGWIWQFDTSPYGGTLNLIIQKIGLTLLAFGFSWNGPYNIMNLPMLGPVFFVGLLAALPAAARRYQQIAYGWPLLAIPVLLFTDLISGAVLEIHALHQMGILPFVCLLSGIGLAHLWLRLLDQLPAYNYVRFIAAGGLIIACLLPAFGSMAHYLNEVIPAQYADPEASWQRAQTDVNIGRFVSAQPDQAFLLPYSEYNRSDTAWVLAEGFRQRRSAIGPDGRLQIPVPPLSFDVIIPAEPERPRHDGFAAHYDPRLWVLLYDNTVWFLPPFSQNQADRIQGLSQNTEPVILSDPSDTIYARVYSVTDSEAFFSQEAVIDFPLQADFNDEIRLVGYTLPSQDLTPGSTIYVTLYWQALRPPTEDYEVFVQLWADDQTQWAGAHDFPYGGMYRTRIWQVNEIVPTHHWLTIPQELPVGRYTLAAGLFRLLHNERVPVSGPNADPALQVAVAPELRYAPPFPELPFPSAEAALRFGDALAVRNLLVNGTAPENTPFQVHPGDNLTVDIYWGAIQKPPVDYTLFLHLSSTADEPPLAQTDALIGSGLPTGAWRPGDLVHDRVLLQVPDNMPVGTYELLLGVYFWQSGERLQPIVQNQAIPEDRFRLVSIRVNASD
jgi:hypothetical protein